MLVKNDYLQELFEYFSPNNLQNFIFSKVSEQQESKQSLSDNINRPEKHCLKINSLKPEVTISDNDFFNNLLPNEICNYFRNQGTLGIYVLSFILRHMTTKLAFETHIKAINPSLPHSQIPIFGFSALGIHQINNTISCCRAYSAFDLPLCKNKTESIFCSEHQGETWWSQLKKESSSQAKMFAFYADINNLHKYSEQELQNMLCDFWQKMRFLNDKKLNTPKIPITEALQTLKIDSIDLLKQIQKNGLRKVYLLEVRKNHPDAGGSHSEFIKLHQSYESLLNYLERDAWNLRPL